ncbi:MAG: energy transducer TonB [Acidobacteria bacterium]|nr:MAG: energy transducer TonB [Acidobacteriota bacterium]
MSLDLFRPVPEGRAKHAGRRLSALPISVVVHVLVVLALVVIPLLATDILPQPPIEELEWTPAVPAPPNPPAPARPRAATATLPQQDPHAAPREVPSQILPYDGIDRDAPPPDPSFDEGVVQGGVDNGTGLVPAIVDTPPPPPAMPVRLSSLKQPQRTVYVAPIYPDLARAAKVEGMVILEAVINPDGVVRDVRVLRSVPLLDEAALAAVRQWRYTPTMLSGVPVAVIMTVTVTFRLQ